MAYDGIEKILLLHHYNLRSIGIQNEEPSPRKWWIKMIWIIG